MKGLVLALQFLTRFPVPISVEFNEKNLKKALFFFPVVSALIGLCVGFGFLCLSQFNLKVASLFSCILWIVLSGGLHMDGLADMFDGFLSNRSTEDILDIMKDSRVGTFGVLSLLLVIISKIILLSALGETLIPDGIYGPNPLTLAIVLISARLGVLHSIAFYPPARSKGLGKMFQDCKPKKMVLISSLIYLLLITFFEAHFLIVYFIGILNGHLISIWSVKKINGVTGDVFGAIMELGEVVCLLGFWGVLQWIS